MARPNLATGLLAYLVLAVCGMLTAARARTAEGDESLRASVARIDITPALPVTLSGYESRKGLSQGVHDPLSARAVAFARGDRKLVLVSTDIIGFYNGTAQSLRAAVLRAGALKEAELFLAAIHTHSAPTLVRDAQNGHSNNVEYTRSLEGLLSRVVREALDSLQPAQLAAGSGAAPVGANRRQVLEDELGNSKTVLGRNPGGSTDPEVQVVRVARADAATPLAVLFGYATHSTSLGPGNYHISGDVHGLAEQYLEGHLGHNVIAPGFAGASGDIDPWFRVLPGFTTTDGWVPEPVLLGTLLGEEVAHVLRRGLKPLAEGPVNALLRTLELPGKPRGDTRVTPDCPPVPFTVTVGRIGPMAFVGLGGEVFHELGKAIKSASPFTYTFLVTHCNGAAGYVPTRQAYTQGGYEVQTSPFAPSAGEILVKETLRLLHEVYSAP